MHLQQQQQQQHQKSVSDKGCLLNQAESAHTDCPTQSIASMCQEGPGLPDCQVCSNPLTQQLPQNLRSSKQLHCTVAPPNRFQVPVEACFHCQTVK
jgi:hypothetical protein